MTNAEMADVLSTIGSLLDLNGENPFKVRAFFNAARTIGGLEIPVGQLVKEGRLRELPGIGAAIEEKLTELHRTGRMEYYDELRKGVPDGVLDMLRVPSLGPKKVKILWRDLGIAGIAELKAACEKDKLLKAKGFGAKSQQNILDVIGRLNEIEGQVLLFKALPVAREMAQRVRDLAGVIRADFCGSLRRGRSIVRDFDLLASSKKPVAICEAFAKMKGVRDVIGQGATKCSVRLDSGLQIDLRVVADDEFATALQYFTGSKEHNVLVRSRAVRMGMTLNEYALMKGTRRLECKTEADVYRHLKLSYIPPELREGRNEIDLAERDEIPQLIERQDLAGALHVHSTHSDGTAKIEEMAEKARAVGYKWMGLSDHSKAATYANGMDAARLKKQMKEVATLNEKWTDFEILQGLECDILPDGSLDLTPAVLGKLDFVIGSIHSRFDMPEPEMTARICKAIRNPHFDVLGHPTGRLLLSRDGYKVDLEKVLQEAKRAGKVVELNANPHRLDLDDVHARRARELGVGLSIGPDAHSVRELDQIEFGLLQARRAGLTKKDVINSLPAEKVKATFAGA